MAEIAAQPVPYLVSDMPASVPAVIEKEEDRRKLNNKVYEQFTRDNHGQLKMTNEQEVALQRGYVDMPFDALYSN